MKDRILCIKAKEVLGPHGYPTIKTIVATEGGSIGESLVPWGMSVGKHEVKKIYDGEKRYKGLGVRNAVKIINEIIAPSIIGTNVSNQSCIDRKMIELDGTSDKSNIGGNTILAVSMAAIKAGAISNHIPLHQYIGGICPKHAPIIISNLIGGGNFYNPGLAFEDYLIMATEFNSVSDAVEAISEVYLALEDIIKKYEPDISTYKGLYTPKHMTDSEVFEALMRAINTTGNAGKINLAIDVCASQFYDQETDTYSVNKNRLSRDEFLKYLVDLSTKYPVKFIEDPLHEDDYEGFSLATKMLLNRVVCGDDLFATNEKRLLEGILNESANSILLKIDQVGTVTEAISTANRAHKNNYSVAVSMRSRDTTDTFIADLAFGIGAEYIKIGAPIMAERTDKLNRMCEIEEELLM